MPLFFFDIDDGEQVHSDGVGTDLPSLEVARDEAKRTLTEIASDTIPSDGDKRRLRIILRDEHSEIGRFVIDFDSSTAGQ